MGGHGSLASCFHDGHAITHCHHILGCEGKGGCCCNSCREAQSPLVSVLLDLKASTALLLPYPRPECFSLTPICEELPEYTCGKSLLGLYYATVVTLFLKNVTCIIINSFENWFPCPSLSVQSLSLHYWFLRTDFS